MNSLDTNIDNYDFDDLLEILGTIPDEDSIERSANILIAKMLLEGKTDLSKFIKNAKDKALFLLENEYYDQTDIISNKQDKDKKFNKKIIDSENTDIDTKDKNINKTYDTDKEDTDKEDTDKEDTDKEDTDKEDIDKGIGTDSDSDSDSDSDTDDIDKQNIDNIDINK